jgi:hypothetical protein
MGLGVRIGALLFLMLPLVACAMARTTPVASLPAPDQPETSAAVQAAEVDDRATAKPPTAGFDLAEAGRKPVTRKFIEPAKISPAASGASRPLAIGGLIGRPAPGGRPTAALPDFPWPPPTPSERLNLRRSQILTVSMGRDPSLSDVGRRIVRALEAAGYSEYSFYAVPGGFAVVARLERVQDDGTPAPDQLRFLAPEAAEPFSLSTYVTRLFFAPQGYYRQIVFAVTTEVVRPSGPAPSARTAQALLQGGADRLPAAFRAMPFTADYQATALIYEYRKGADARDVITLTPGRLDARTNLIRAGIYKQLVSAQN